MITAGDSVKPIPLVLLTAVIYIGLAQGAMLPFINVFKGAYLGFLPLEVGR